MASLLETLGRQLAPFSHAPRWLIAYSGGVDSHVLLHLVQRYAQSLATASRPQIVAVHINHQLQAEANQWAAHCQQQAALLGVVYLPVTVEVRCGARESLEDKARQARYQAFEQLLAPGDLLLMGHHLDDQVETLLMRLLRGSGSRGVAAMPQQRAIGHSQLLRPLLEIPRAELVSYAEQQDLHWVEDPSNQSSDFDRNFLRLQLLPLMAERWPQYRQTLSRAAALSEESAQLNDELAAADFHSLSLSPELPSIPLNGFRELSHARQKNLLRYWLRQRQLGMPSALQLQQVLDSVIAAKPDAEPLVEWPGVQARRFKDELYCMTPLASVDTQASYHWQLNSSLAIDGVGQLSVQRTNGHGISTERLPQAALEVRFRRGGERCQPAGRSGSQSLKKLFQEYAVEPWLRDRVPLLFCGEELVAVADLWVCQHWQASGAEPGWLLHWQKVK
jgi:tRNA(Ile)-lysidine synthase